MPARSDAESFHVDQIRRDPAALARLRARLLKFARNELRDDAQAEDVTQDTMLALWQQPERYRGDAPYLTYAISVLKFKIIDLYRARQRETPVDDTALDALAEQTVPVGMTETVDAGDALDARRARSAFWPRLHACLAELPARTRAAYWLHDVLELDIGTVSRHLGVTANHSSVMSHRARAHLKRRWDDVATAAA